jgi:hypothetical protein
MRVNTYNRPRYHPDRLAATRAVRRMAVSVECLAMRILGVRWEPVARVIAVVYGLFGVGAFCLSEFTRASQLTLPLGILAPVIHLNFNFNVPRPSGVLSGLLAGAAEILAYAVTGWIAGAATALCFNIVCRQLGGIDAKYVSIANENDPVN